MSILAESPAVVIPDGTWSIDPVWSTLEFEVRKIGLFTDQGPRSRVLRNDPRRRPRPRSREPFDVASITTFDETRDGHLQSPDFFDVERYPELRFESTVGRRRRRRARGDGRPHDQGRDEAGRAQRHVPRSSGRIPYGNDRIGLELETTIDRTDFGLDWNAPLPGGGFLLPNDVVLRADFAAVRAA